MTVRGHVPQSCSRLPALKSQQASRKRRSRKPEDAPWSQLEGWPTNSEMQAGFFSFAYSFRRRCGLWIVSARSNPMAASPCRKQHPFRRKSINPTRHKHLGQEIKMLSVKPIKQPRHCSAEHTARPAQRRHRPHAVPPCGAVHGPWPNVKGSS